MRVEGDIVVGVVVMVVVVSVVGMGSSTVSSRVVSACAANVDSTKRPPRAVDERRLERIAAKRPPRAVDGRERRSEAAPTAALAASSRGDALSPRVPVSAGAAGKRASEAGIFAWFHYDFRSVWSGLTVGARDSSEKACDAGERATGLASSKVGQVGLG